MKKLSAALEVLKSAVLLALVISMVALASTYIISTQSEKLNLRGDIVFNKLFNVESNASGFCFDHILPEIIAIKKDGESPKAMIANSRYLSDMHELIVACFADAFAETSDCAELDVAEGEKLWNECVGSDSYVYVRYHTQFPISVLYAHSKNADESGLYKLENGIGGYVYEFFILDNSMIARSQNGTVMRFAVGEEEKITVLSDLDRYVSRCYDFTFAQGNEEFSLLDVTAPIFDNSISLKKLKADGFALSEFENTSSEHFRELMRAFDFNPDKLNTYVDAEDKNASMYVESHGVLKISSANIEYTASSDGGVHVSDYLDYQIGASGYDPYDYLKAAERFAESLHSLSPVAFGDYASLGISYVAYKDGVFIVEYSYYYENVPIEYGAEEIAIRIEISDSKFVNILARPLSVTVLDGVVRSYSQRIALGIAMKKTDDIAAQRLNMRLRYTIPETLEEETSAEWEALVK